MSEEHGFRRVITEIIVGLIPSIFITALAESKTLDSSSLPLFHLASIAFSILLIIKMKYWSTKYLIGWVIGISIMIMSGLVGTFEAALYFLVPLTILIRRHLE